MEIGESDQKWAGDVAILQNQEARTARHVGSLAFDCPLRQGYDEGVEVISLLPTERLEERNGCTVATDIGADGARYIEFWVDATPDSQHEEVDIQHHQLLKRPCLVTSVHQQENHLKPMLLDKVVLD